LVLSALVLSALVLSALVLSALVLSALVLSALVSVSLFVLSRCEFEQKSGNKSSMDPLTSDLANMLQFQEADLHRPVKSLEVALHTVHFAVRR
jgi:hypothetical protein